MPLKLLLFILLSLPFLVAASPPGDEVVRVHDVPRERLNELRHLGDFWGIDWREGYAVMLVNERGRRALEALGYRVEHDRQRDASRRSFQQLDRTAWARSGIGGIPNYPCYRTVDETHADLAALASTYPDLARWESIGQSWEAGQPGSGGDEIFVLVLANQNVGHAQAPLLIMGAQHSRELVTAEVAARFGEYLVEHYASNPVARWLLDHRQIHIVAQQNPDGRRQVEDGNSSWRKNARNDCADYDPPFSFPGVDLNRNSNFLYGNYSSASSCDQTYRGPSAGSEPETQAIQDYFEIVFERQRPVTESGFDLITPAPDDTRGIFLSLHSFGQMVLLPWEGLGGQNENNAPNHDQLTILGRKLGFYTSYAVARWDLLGPAGGTTVDYAYGEFGVAAYTMELGTDFLQSCQEFEDTIWPDNFQALLYAAKAAERPYQAPAGPEVIELSAGIAGPGGLISIAGVADSSGYFRGNVSEPPEHDPIHPIVSVVASIDLPPHLADQTFSLDLIEAGSVANFGGSLVVEDNTGPDRLIFVQASDDQGNVGVATPVWLPSNRIFEDRFESP